jgi:hypothetical protein
MESLLQQWYVKSSASGGWTQYLLFFCWLVPYYFL